MPLLGAGWLSGYVVTTFAGLSRGLKWTTSTSYFATRVLRSSSNSGQLGGDAERAVEDVSSKPPNILIYSGSSDTHNKTFNALKQTLLQVINLHSYAIYKLHEKHVNTHPWMDNTTLLVLGNNDSMSASVQKDFIKYLTGGGKILSLCSSFTCNVKKLPWDDKYCPFPASFEVKHPEFFQGEPQNLSALCEPFYFEGDQTVVVQEAETKNPVVIQLHEGHGSAVLCLIDLTFLDDYPAVKLQDQEQEWDACLKKSRNSRIGLLSNILQFLGINCQPQNAPELTPLLLLAKKIDQDKLFHSLKSSLKNNVCNGNDLSLHFVPNGQPIPKATDTLLPVITGDKKCQTLSFNWKKYQEHLKTKVLGQVMFYTDVITSTQTVFDGNYTFVQNIPEDVGVIVTAAQQIKGQGRGGNIWLSPAGCMMFSIHIRIPFASNLGQRPPFLQHIASLAIVNAVRSKSGYEEINVCLKWPNDIYFGDKVKIGGVIVTSSAMSGTLSAVIGMGVNLTNSKPTISINEIISQYNKEHNTNLEPLVLEEILARTVNNIETLIDDFQDNGSDSFLTNYYKHWLHSDARVKLAMNGTVEEVKITGLDDFGFLSVQTNSGKTLSVQPDGNSFDMLKNLIAMKDS